MGKFYPYIKQL